MEIKVILIDLISKNIFSTFLLTLLNNKILWKT
jgi:hypothetical protein